jgi:hypothetical protein
MDKILSSNNFVEEVVNLYSDTIFKIAYGLLSDTAIK